MVHLLNYRNYKISELSGGMRQRAALSKALKYRLQKGKGFPIKVKVQDKKI